MLVAALLAFTGAQFNSLSYAGVPKKLQQQPIILDSMSATDEYGKKLSEDLKAKGVTVVELFHAGEDTPPELEGLIRWLAGEGILVKYKFVPREELDLLAEKQAQSVPNEILDLPTQILYSQSPADQLSPQALTQTRYSLRKEIASRFKHLFGIPRGISFMSYVTQRPSKERLVEAGVAITKTVVTSLVMIHSLSAKQAMGHDVNIVLPVIVAAAFNLGFDYWQRGNSAFKGQGIDYNFDESKAVMNRKFYLLTAFVHSVIVREAIMAAAHITSNGFGMGWMDAWVALQTSAKGLLGKAPVEMFIERGRRTRGQWWAIGWMTAWGSFYASLQILDMFQMGNVFRATLTALGAIGLTYELYKDRSMIYQSVNRLFKRLTGLTKNTDCKTLLSPKKTNPSE